MTIFGYLRVSTMHQNIDTNMQEITNLAYSKQLYIEPENWIRETVSGRRDWRSRELGKAFEKMKCGDTLIMSEYSRIGRNFLQSMEFLAECRRKNISIFSTIGDIKFMDTDSNSTLLLALHAWRSQVERENIIYRTKVGIKNYQDKGGKFGRKKLSMILDGKNNIDSENNIKKIRDMLDKDIKLKIIAKEMRCTTVTLRKFIKKYNLKENKTKKSIKEIKPKEIKTI